MLVRRPPDRRHPMGQQRRLVTSRKRAALHRLVRGLLTYLVRQGRLPVGIGRSCRWASASDSSRTRPSAPRAARRLRALGAVQPVAVRAAARGWPVDGGRPVQRGTAGPQRLRPARLQRPLSAAWSWAPLRRPIKHLLLEVTPYSIHDLLRKSILLNHYGTFNSTTSPIVYFYAPLCYTDFI